MNKLAVIEVPEPIEAKRRAWASLWRNFATLHYGLGGLSVACAAIAATGVSYAQGLAAAAAILTALLGFIQPERKYLKFVRAWRVIDSASLKYSLGLTDLAALAAAAERGEQLITEFEAKNEQEPITPSRPVTPPAQQNPPEGTGKKT